jgi:hypothetical protein
MKNTFRSILLIGVCALIAVLSGCASIQAGVTKVEGDIAGKADTITIADAENAKAGAAANLADPAKTEVTNCANDAENYLAAVVASLDAAAAPSATASTFNPAQLGILTGAVDLDIVAAQKPIDLTANIPPAPHQLVVDCAIVVTDAKLVLAKLGLDAGALAAAAKAGQLAGVKAALAAVRAGAKP